MEHFAQILNIPILQAVGVILVIGIAERVGIPVIAFIKSVLKMNGDNVKDLKNIPAWAAQLQQHFNHDTTQKWEEFNTALRELVKEQRDHNKLEVEVHQILKEFKEYGIRIRE